MLKELRRLDIAACDPNTPTDAAMEAILKLPALEARERALRDQIKSCRSDTRHVCNNHLSRCSPWFRGRGWYWHVVAEWDKQGRIGDDTDLDMHVH